ncbi:3-deoxy-D-manno-octulosonic acid transferase [Dysgonomonas sp. 25]|uniref:3-deoxy-D-manno-octulosonic acid transferase n=1 Tax=Dysgonomonas sp. 25 TaxID=2302933 RepID=UPI0013D4ACE0|nr:glycosyltransferase N-terminal domain-containing protein [Dysgonomonas sp. 25]NDV68788.1 3-deoxy-D-manno-octulosonic acid transferase [Dysgonomonas sp. 25]NDV70178.1 3-deoxy-D-manno-octulosonic acid transferase [Dysgonomonas sp. 25]
MLFYNIGIFLYALVVRIISPFHRKARKMIVGHKETYTILRKKVDPNAQYIWFHAASLGEFEQGRPIIEQVKKQHPEYKILLTFFSPSGYEVRKDYPLADVVCYLPFDKKRNVRKFLGLVQPKMAVFIKYEFWYNFVSQLHKRDIPVYMVSAIFRPKQIFFRWYGKSMQKLLHMYHCLCVQDEASKDLLKTIDVTNVEVCGDTRFDRVLDISKQAKDIDLIARFATKAQADGQKILVAGSSWPKDEDIFVTYFNATSHLKLIIAPHEIHEAHLKYIEENLQRPFVRYSKATAEDVEKVDCIILDTMGMLSSVYRYGQIAYVGGGFGVGIHNVLEAAVYGIPVLFGPNFKKFIEAIGLIESGGGYSVNDYETFRGLMDELIEYPESLSSAGNHARQYVIEHTGAVDKVVSLLPL